MMFELLWPERRIVGEGRIETWYADAIANGEISIADGRAKTAYDMAMALQNAGSITVGRAIDEA
jgi:hypothetical protein